MGFEGQWFDRQSDLFYKRFRQYDPLTIQYAAIDPIGFKGGLKPSSYVDCAATQVAPFGLIFKEQVPYGSTDVSQAVIQQRIKENNLSADHSNYAAARIVRKSNGKSRIACAENKDPLHSEEILYGQLQPGESITISTQSALLARVAAA